MYAVYMSKRFYFMQFSLAQVRSSLLFDLLRGPCWVLLLRARVDLRVMATKGCSAFPKTPALLELHHQIG